MTPDGKTLLVANQGTKEKPSTTVSIIDTSSFRVVDTVETGQGAHGVVIEPSGRYAYITNLYGDNLAVLDIPARQVVATVPTGSGPNGVSFIPGPVVAAPATQIELGLPPMGQEMDMDHAG